MDYLEKKKEEQGRDHIHSKSNQRQIPNIIAVVQHMVIVVIECGPVWILKIEIWPSGSKRLPTPNVDHSLNLNTS